MNCKNIFGAKIWIFINWIFVLISLVRHSISGANDSAIFTVIYYFVFGIFITLPALMLLLICDFILIHYKVSLKQSIIIYSSLLLIIGIAYYFNLLELRDSSLILMSILSIILLLLVISRTIYEIFKSNKGYYKS